MEDFTMEADPGLITTEAGSKTTAGVAVHGKCMAGADIEYRIKKSSASGTVTAEDDWVYPDFSEIDPDCEPAVIQASNWQGTALFPDELKTNVIYTVEAEATGSPMVTDPDTGGGSPIREFGNRRSGTGRVPIIQSTGNGFNFPDRQALRNHS